VTSVSRLSNNKHASRNIIVSNYRAKYFDFVELIVNGFVANEYCCLMLSSDDETLLITEFDKNERTSALRWTAECRFIPKTLLLTGRESRPVGNRLKRFVLFVRNPKKKHLLPKSRYKYTIENPFDGLVIELMKRVLGITVTSWKPVV